MQAANKHTKTVNKTSTGKLRGLSHRPQLGVSILIAAVVAVSSLVVYSAGYKSGEDSARQATKTKPATDKVSSSLLVVPAGGKVSDINSQSITVQLLGAETRQVKIDNQTTVADKNGTAEVKDIKKGSTVILFTKQSGDDIVATRIIVQ